MEKEIVNDKLYCSVIIDLIICEEFNLLKFSIRFRFIMKFDKDLIRSENE